MRRLAKMAREDNGGRAVGSARLAQPAQGYPWDTFYAEDPDDLATLLPRTRCEPRHDRRIAKNNLHGVAGVGRGGI